MAFEKKTTYRSPSGTLVWPRLIEADTKFKEEGEYSTKLRVSGAEAAGLVAEIDRQAANSLATAKANETSPAKAKKWTSKHLPYEMEEDDDGNETGDILFKFKARATGVSRKTGKAWARRIPLFDAKGGVINTDGLEVWGGTVAKIAFQFIPYAPTTVVGASVSLGIQAVQVLELVSGSQQSAGAFGFGEEEGYTHEVEKDTDGPFEADTDSATEDDF